MANAPKKAKKTKTPLEDGAVLASAPFSLGGYTFARAADGVYFNSKTGTRVGTIEECEAVAEAFETLYENFIEMGKQV